MLTYILYGVFGLILLFMGLSCLKSKRMHRGGVLMCVTSAFLILYCVLSFFTAHPA